MQALPLTCPNCPSCSFYVPPSGSKSAKIAIIGEAPGEEELRQRRPFVGPAGRLLWEELARLGIRREDCWVYNAVPCLDIHKEKTPKHTTVKRWRQHVLEELSGTSAEVVLLLGRVAVCSILDMKPAEVLIGDVNATVIELDLGGRVVKCVPVIHPSAVLRSGSSEHSRQMLVAGLSKAVQLLRGQSTAEWYKGHRVVTTLADFDMIRDDIAIDGNVVIDIEEIRDGEKHVGLLIGLYVPVGQQLVYSIPLGEWYGEEVEYDSRTVAAFLKEVFDSVPKNRIIGHNVNYDIRVLRAHGLIRADQYATDDTMLMAHLLDARRWGALSLKDIGRDLFAIEPYWIDARRAMSKGLSSLSVDQVLEYNGRDCVLTYRVFRHLMDSLGKNSRLLKFYRDLLMPVNRILLETEYNGLLISVETLDALRAEWSASLESIGSQLSAYDPDRNWNSPQQVAQFLYDHLSLPVPRITDTSQRSTDEDTLRQLEGLHPVVDLLLQYREIRKKVETLDRLKEAISDDGRIHPVFNLAGTVSGRSSSTPNVQNFERGAGIRDIVVSPPGYKLVEADLSQIELRWLSVLYDEKTLQRSLINGEDIHLKTAMLAFNKGQNEVTPEERTLGKTVNFSSGYGAGPRKIASVLRRTGNVTRDQAVRVLGSVPEGKDPVVVLASRLYDAFHKQFPRVKVAWGEIENKLRSTGFVESAFGRAFRVADFSSLPPEYRGRIAREAANFIVQSSAADTLWLCLLDVYDTAKSLGAKIVNVVHDSILAEVPEEHVEEYSKRVLSIMRNPRFADFGVHMPVPIDAGIKVGDSWGHMHDVGAEQHVDETDSHRVVQPSFEDYINTYVRNRWCVIAAPPREKAPIQDWANVDFYVPSDGEIKAWKAQGMNIGLLTGRKSGLVVVDVDGKSGGFETLAELGIDSPVKVRTGGGGLHLYYKYPAIDETCRLASKVGVYPGIDVRADGGFVVAPPSVHASGNTYMFECDLADVRAELLPEVPEPILNKILTERRLSDIASLGPIGSKVLGPDTIDRLVSILAPVWDRGHRHNAALCLVGALAKRGFRVDDVAKLIESLANATGDDELVDRFRTIESTYDRLASGDSINGMTGIRDIFGDDVSKAVLEAIGSYRRIRDIECFTLGEFSDHPIYIPEWIVEGLLPVEGFAQLAGHPGAGKTTLALQLAAQLAAGVPFLGKFSVPRSRRTLYLQSDNPPAMMSEIINAIIKRVPAARDNVILANVRGSIHIDDEGGFETISELCRIYKPDLVIFDTIRDFHRANEIDPNAAAEVVAAIDKLRAKYRVAVLFINHLSKSSGFKRAAIEAHMGTMRWVTKADLDILLEDVNMDAGPTGDYVRLVFAKVRWSQRMSPMTLRRDSRWFVEVT